MGWAKLALLIAILFVIAVVNDWSTPDRMILTLLVVMAVCWVWSRLSVRRLAFTRSLSLDRVRAGDSIQEDLVLRNLSWLPRLWVEFQDHSTLPAYQAGQVVSLGARGRAEWRTRGRCSWRGRYRLGPVTIRSGDPLGLFPRETQVKAVHTLLVYPAALDVGSVPLPAANLSGARAVNRTMMTSANSISGLREYAPGDPLNRISWSATARRGQMMVKEFDPDPTADLWVLVDVGGPAEPRPTDWRNGSPPGQSGGSDDGSPVLTSTNEVVIALAGSIAERALSEGRKVGLIVNRAMPFRIEPDNSQRQWFRIFEALALASPFGRRSISEAIATDNRKFSRTSGLVVVTAGSSLDWVTAARGLVQRRVPVVAVLVDDDGAVEGGAGGALLEALAAAHVAVASFDGRGKPTAPHPSALRRFA